MLEALLVGLPDFLAYFAGGSLAMLFFAFCYRRITPHAEMAMIKQGNLAAALGFSGALLGYALPLYSAIAHSVSLTDMTIWAGIGLFVQFLVVAGMRLALRGLFQDIARGNSAVGLLLAVVSITAGMVNAGSMTY